MVKKADIGSKRLISLAPDNWVKWVTEKENLTVKEFISSEFQWISRENDVLLKVSSPEGEFLVLNELQLRYKETMPLRIRAYAALAQERYNLPVYPVLINILLNSKVQQIPNFYELDFMGIKAYQSYKVINLWEIEANSVFEYNLSSLLPFVPILKGGGEESVVRQAVLELRANENLSDLEPLLSFFASFVLDIPIIQQIMRWDMTVLRESPWYQEILKEGLKIGESRGLQEGEVNLILRLLSKRFGKIDDGVASQIRQLQIPQLELLADNLLHFSDLKELSDWLRENT